MNTFTPESINISSPAFQHKIRELQRSEGGIYLPYLATQWSCTIQDLCNRLVDEYPQAYMSNNLLCLEAKNELWYYEVCDTKYVRGDVLRSDLVNTFCKQNTKEDQHISVFTKDRYWVKQINETNSIKKSANARVKALSIWIELDRKYENGFSPAYDDACWFLDDFPYPDSVRLWTSGNQSIHIEIDAALFGNPQGYAKMLCGRDGSIYRLVRRLFGNKRHPELPDIDPWNDDEDKVKEVYLMLGRGNPKQGYKQELEQFDPNIYSYNSLIRAPWSLHEKSKGQKKLLIGPEKFDSEPNKLTWMYIEEMIKPKRVKKVFDCGADSSYIVQEFSDIPGFDPDDADGNGWIGRLHNPFYNDENPGLSVNINDGRFWDFGDPDYQIGFVEYLMNKYEINHNQAVQMIKDNDEHN